jgi:hypothetical protein
MSVDPTRPGNTYKGADFQLYQILRRQLTAPPPPPPPRHVPVVTNPVFPKVSYPVTRSYPDRVLPPLPDTSPLPGFPPYRGPAKQGVSHVSSGVGFNEALTRKSSEIAAETVEHVWPLRVCAELGDSIAGAGLRVRALLALLCAVAGIGLAASAGYSGPTLLFALAGSGGLGWVLPTVLGLFLAFAAQLTGLLLGILVRLLLVALVILAIILVIRSIH